MHTLTSLYKPKPYFMKSDKQTSYMIYQQLMMKIDTQNLNINDIFKISCLALICVTKPLK